MTTSNRKCRSCWSAIQSETGFQSYVEYLENYQETHPHCGSILAQVSKQNEGRIWGHLKTDSCTIIDILRGNDKDIHTTAVGYDHFILGIKNIVESIRHPPQDAIFRVVLWWTYDSPQFSEDFLNACGLGLRLDPRFFEALQELKEIDVPKDVRMTATRGLRPSFTVLGNQAATVTRDYIPGKANAPPILLVVGWGNNGGRNGKAISDNIQQLEFHDFPLEWMPSFSQASKADPELYGYHHKNARRHYTVEAYVTVLGELLEQLSDELLEDVDLEVVTLMPLMYLDALHLQLKSRSLRQKLRLDLDKEEAILLQRLRDQQFWLRRHVEDSEANIIHFWEYCFPYPPRVSWSRYKVSHKKGLLAIKRFWKHAVNEARAVDVEMRDNMQLRLGNLSLIESKRSIELSNSQIQEAKRSG